MNEPKTKGKFAVANGPVNRRTATPGPRTADAKASPLALSRLRAMQAKHQLGAPLSQRLNNDGNRATSPLRAKVIAQSIGGTIAGVGAFVASLQGVWAGAALGAAAFLGFGGLAWRNHRAKRAANHLSMTHIARVVDAQDLERLDALLEQVGRASTPTTVNLLVAFKEALVRCVTLAASAQGDNGLPSEDTLFIGQAVKRYVPDSLQAFLAVPAAERETRDIEGGKTAAVLVLEQLRLIEQKINQCEARLNQQSGEALLQQQRFLTAKTRS